MPYKISGTLSDTARIIIIKESDWSIESNTTESVGAYEVGSLVTGAKWVIARKSDGELLAFGNVTPEEIFAGNRGVFGGGSNVIDYIDISSTGDATDFGDLTVQSQTSISACSNGITGRGLFGGGQGDPNIIDYITISSPGNATHFGDLLAHRYGIAASSNGTNDRGVFFTGDYPTPTNTIDYVTISSTGDAVDFGDVTTGKYKAAATSNGTNNRGIVGGGSKYTTSWTTYNTIEYINISSTGNASAFGILTSRRRFLAAASNGTNNRGLFAGGYRNSSYNVIDYVTISSTGDATDFGDLVADYYAHAGTSNGTNDRAVFGGGYPNYDPIDYVTISSTGNAQDFGDLSAFGRQGLAATSNA